MTHIIESNFPLSEEQEKEILGLKKEGLDIQLNIFLTDSLISKTEPFIILKKAHDLGISCIDFNMEQDLDTIKRNNWLNLLYSQNEDLYKIPVLMFDNIRKDIKSKQQKVINEKCRGCEFHKFCNEKYQKLPWKDNICQAPVPIFQQILQDIAENIDNKNSTFTTLEDLILKKFENPSELWPETELKSYKSEPGKLVPLLHNVHKETMSLNMDEVYNVANLLFIKDPTEKLVTFNKLNKLLSVPSYYMELLSNNPLKRFDIEMEVIDKRDEDAKEPNFVYPKNTNYKVFKENKFGNIQIGGKNVMYYFLNLPKEYYLTHYKYYDHLLYNTDTGRYQAFQKPDIELQELINSIAEEGFRCPLLFYVNQSGMLKGICNKARLMIARYLDLPSIPAVIILAESAGSFANSISGNLREMAEKYLSPYIVLSPLPETDYLLQYVWPNSIAYEMLAGLQENLIDFLVCNSLIKIEDIKLRGTSCKGCIFEDGSFLMWNNLYHDYFYYNFGIFEREIEYKIVKLTNIMGEMEAYMPKRPTKKQLKTLDWFKEKIKIKEVEHLPMITWNL